MIYIEGEGWRHTEETKIKMAAAKRGKTQSEESNKKRSATLKANPPMLGKHHTPASIEKMILAKKGKPSKRIGYKHSEETLIKMREVCKGEKSCRWKGGISYLPYCPKFNRKLKEEVRNKYKRKCFLCGKTEAENDGKNMCVHHIDYDKEQGCNGKTFELVPLCKSCHSKTNGERDGYKNEIINKLRSINDTCN